MQTVSFTITNPATDSDWQAPKQVAGTVTRLMRLVTDANCPSQTLTLSVRDTADNVVKAVQSWSLSVGSDQAFGAADMAALASLADGLEWRFTLGAAPGSTTVIKLTTI